MEYILERRGCNGALNPRFYDGVKLGPFPIGGRSVVLVSFPGIVRGVDVIKDLKTITMSEKDLRPNFVIQVFEIKL